MNCIKKILRTAAAVCAIIVPGTAYADWGVIDAFDLSPFVPIVLDAFMTVATGGYEYFVGNGDGIIYLMIWGFLAISVVLYLIKIYICRRNGSDFSVFRAAANWRRARTRHPLVKIFSIRDYARSLPPRFCCN